MELTIKTFKTENGYGFDILRDGKPWIHQPFKPDVEGFQPFETEEEAKLAAEEMIKKIAKPPARILLEFEEPLTEFELEQLELSLKKIESFKCLKELPR